MKNKLHNLHEATNRIKYQMEKILEHQRRNELWEEKIETLKDRETEEMTAEGKNWRCNLLI